MSSSSNHLRAGSRIALAGAVLSLGAGLLMTIRWGRELITAVPEILLIQTRPEAIQLPHVIEIAGGSLELGHVQRDYGVLVLLLLALTLGLALLLHSLLKRSWQDRPLRAWARLLIVGAGLSLFGSGFVLLKSDFRLIALFQEVGRLETSNPFLLTHHLPLKLFSWFPVLLTISMTLLSAVAIIGFGKPQPLLKGRVEQPAARFLPITLTLTFLGVLCLAGYAAYAWIGPIRTLLRTSMTLGGEDPAPTSGFSSLVTLLSYTAVAVQAGGLNLALSAVVFPRRG